jgi:hypothetical protein
MSSRSSDVSLWIAASAGGPCVDRRDYPFVQSKGGFWLGGLFLWRHFHRLAWHVSIMRAQLDRSRPETSVNDLLFHEGGVSHPGEPQWPASAASKAGAALHRFQQHPAAQATHPRLRSGKSKFLGRRTAYLAAAVPK